MPGVYGDFIELFPELHETLTVWSKDDKSDSKYIRAVYIPKGGESIKRRKYTSGNTGLDIADSDQVYAKSSCGLKDGDYFTRTQDNNIIYRVVGSLPYSKAAGYSVFTVERVTGTTIHKTDNLNVREATFA